MLSRIKDKGTQEGVISTMQTRMELYDMLLPRFMSKNG